MRGKHITVKHLILVIGNYHEFQYWHALGWRKGSLDYMFDVAKTERELWEKIEKLKSVYSGIGYNIQLVDERKPIPTPVS